MGKEHIMANNKMKARSKPSPGKAIGKQPSLKQIIQKLRRHLPELRRRYKVNYLGVFGSYVHGEQRKRSDLDILVEFDEAPSLFGFIDLQDDLSGLLGLKVDLVMKSALKPTIGRYILAEVVPV
jgi:hypothetical protein